jgi:2-dehydro-3-deoxyphosphogluconate aldolase/(4S)-4-hydroxy-2-oxoglutarate aldolase
MIPSGARAAGIELPSEIAGRLRAAGVIPVVEIRNADRAVGLARALEAGGLPVVEVTFRTAAAGEALRRIGREVAGMLLIAGTVTSAEQVEAARDAGASLLVSPGLNPSVVEHATGVGMPMMPGVCTPSEVEAALSMGLRAVKLFPVEPVGGVRYLRALAAPYAAMTWNPTGGISLSTLPDYLAVPSVLACGGSWIAPRSEIDAGSFAEIAVRAAEAVKAVQAARPDAGGSR